jgi:hypothetical protein
MGYTVFISQRNEDYQTMAIYKHLDLSIAHISDADNGLLSSGVDLTYHDHDYGYYIPVPSTDSILAEKVEQAKACGLSDDFCRLLIMAHANECTLIVLDGDAEIDDNLPIFDW